MPPSYSSNITIIRLHLQTIFFFLFFSLLFPPHDPHLNVHEDAVHNGVGTLIEKGEARARRRHPAPPPALAPQEVLECIYRRELLLDGQVGDERGPIRRRNDHAV